MGEHNFKHILGSFKTQKEALVKLKDKANFQEFRKKNLNITKNKIKESVNEDNLIIQTISSNEELNKVINILVKRLREWYELYYPELSKEINDHEKFIKAITQKPKDSMGADLSKEDLATITELKEKIQSLYNLKNYEEKYLEKIMQKNCPNLVALSGTQIGAKLIKKAGSLKKLALMPASTIQLLGAEKALFRHIKTGAKSPRHGLILQHILISSAPNRLRGKISRQFADKVSIAVKIDYFKGKFIGDKLKRKLEESVKKIKTK